MSYYLSQGEGISSYSELPVINIQSSEWLLSDLWHDCIQFVLVYTGLILIFFLYDCVYTKIDHACH